MEERTVYRFKGMNLTVEITEEEMSSKLSGYYGGENNEGYFCGRESLPGWRKIILDLHDKLVEESPDYYIIQIKEKFGGLRYYVGGTTYAGYDMIDEAERLSYVTCETCGRPGEPTSKGWTRTLCVYDRFIADLNMFLYNMTTHPIHNIKRSLRARKRRLAK